MVKPDHLMAEKQKNNRDRQKGITKPKKNIFKNLPLTSVGILTLDE
jgi:hypothetical protein